MNDEHPGDHPPRFEFDEYQDEVIAKLAAALQNVGMLTLFFGVGLCTRAVWMFFMLSRLGRRELGMTAIVSAFGQVTVAWMLVTAGRKLMSVARGEGDDLLLVMDALKKLGTVYIVQASITGVMILGLVVLGVSL